jgi:CRISPR-associated endonuclease/helicase Cas3
MDDPITYTRFFETFYPMLNDMGSRFNDLLTRDGVNCQFRSAAQEFKLIDDKAQRPVIVRYGKKCERLIKDLRSIGPKKDIMRKLQRYTVNLSVYMINKMKAEGLLEEICDGILVQTMPNLYSRKTGLDIFRESLPVEDLII